MGDYSLDAQLKLHGWRGHAGPLCHRVRMLWKSHRALEEEKKEGRQKATAEQSRSL